MTCEVHGQAAKPNPNLETVMGQLLTPTASDWKGRTNWQAAGRNGPQRLADSVPTGGGYVSEPVLRRGDDGLSGRVDRLKALGNAVVPQVAAIPLQRVIEIHAQTKNNQAVN
jgi:hypothetical protein